MNNQAIDLYLKTKKDWDKRASVRISEENYDLNLIDSGVDENWHLPSYSGILQHKDLTSLNDSQKRFIMGTQLLEFVEKTAIFEVEYVNKVANSLALNKYNFEIPEILKIDALKIYTDEGFHAHFSKKMSNDIKEYYNIDDDLYPFLKGFFEKVENIGSKFEKKYKHLSEIASTIVSESMIVQDMSGEMKGIVYKPIIAMFKDHMIDEAFHANYFGTLFKIIWPQLNEFEKEIMGFNLFESMIIFGTPRVDIYYYSLSRLGYSKEFISKCIEDTYGTSNWKIDNIKKRMSQTLKLLDICGVFKISSVRQCFLKQGLIN